VAQFAGSGIFATAVESAYDEAAATKAAPKGAAENSARRLSAFAASDFFGDRQPLPGELVPMQFSSRAFGLRLLFSALARLLAVDLRRIGRRLMHRFHRTLRTGAARRRLHAVKLVSGLSQRPLAASQKEGRHLTRYSVMVDRPSIVSIVVLLYDDGLVAISVVALSNQVTIAIPVVGSDGYTNRPDPDLFCHGRHCAANASYGNNYEC
jgi:hypothetical protein